MKKHLLFLILPLIACLASCSDNDEPGPEPEIIFALESVSDSQAYKMDYRSVDPGCGMPLMYFITVSADKPLEMTLRREDSTDPFMFDFTGKYYAFEDEKTGMEASITDNKLTLKFSPVTLKDNAPENFEFYVRDKKDEDFGVSFVIYRCAPYILE